MAELQHRVHTVSPFLRHLKTAHEAASHGVELKSKFRIAGMLQAQTRGSSMV